MPRGLLRDSALYAAADFAFRGLAYAMFPLYATVLTVGEFGVLELLITGAGLLGVVANQGVSNAVSRYYYDPESPPTRRFGYIRAGLLLLLAAAGLASVLAAVVLWISREQLETRFAIIPALALLALAGVLPAQVAQYAQDVLRLRFEAKHFLLLLSLRNALALAATVVLLLGAGWGVAAVLAGTLLGALAALPLALWFLRSELRVAPAPGDVRRLFSFGHGFMYMGLAYWLFGSLDRWMLADLSDLENVGWYAVAMKIAAIVTFLTSAFSQAWTPHAMKIFGEQAAPGLAYGRVLLHWTAVLAAAALALGLFAREILVLLTPPAYWPAATAAALCVSAAAFLGTTQVTALGISLAKRTGVFVVLSWSAAGLNLVLNLIFIPRFGAAGAAAASFLSAAALSALYLAWTQRLYPFNVDYPPLVFCVVCIAAAPLLAWGLDRIAEDPARIAAKLLALAAVAGIGLRIGLLDRRAIRELLSRK
jgi:O-antigen/teichoic acid export membrane protein